MKKNPAVMQKQLAEIIGRSERIIKTRTVEMQKKGLICREKGKRNGKWEILVREPGSHIKKELINLQSVEEENRELRGNRKWEKNCRKCL